MHAHVLDAFSEGRIQAAPDIFEISGVFPLKTQQVFSSMLGRNGVVFTKTESVFKMSDDDAFLLGLTRENKFPRVFMQRCIV